MKKSYDFIIPNRVSTNVFPKSTIQSSGLNFYLFCRSNLSPQFRKEVGRMLKKYGVCETFLYKSFSEYSTSTYGVAFFHKSPDGKVREVVEICPFPDPYETIGILKNKDRSIVEYEKCFNHHEICWSGKELMKGKSFTPIPCPFGLDLVPKSQSSIIRIVPSEIPTIVAAAFDPTATFIGANEEQLSSTLAKEVLKDKTLIYYPLNNQYEEALKMQERLTNQSLNIHISPFMNKKSFYGKCKNSDITDYIWMGSSKGWKHADIMKRIYAFDPLFNSKENYSYKQTAG